MNTGLSFAEPQVALPPRMWLHWCQGQVGTKAGPGETVRAERSEAQAVPAQTATHTHHQEALAVLELIVAQVQEV